MKILTRKNTAEYECIQIKRSRTKFNFYKVASVDTNRWKNIIKSDLRTKNPSTKIYCLGTRSGKEIDLFPG